ncbi:hypothetical protein Back11_01250 [Paenibacillus baekrokdamisoli]|uniref:tRNA nuclease CdiA C-terminal domain-containing protein n=1 Tax=Paenibacillus baekrokdamisoli TaxID=1712516 RepID=A0A3G9IIH1_9BACL|nr:hypothetical protein [Paenibacillus baekrokdamisoli]MBB3069247.1 YD repeat-containing protein [Paenibacillus baekrokdamisoli]BBH18780.1 hypothetical protein Back11_01250 [Paenibacillus baekrokdamisoli]
MGKIIKIKTTQSLVDGKTSIHERIFNATTNYAYPSDIRSYFTTKSTTGENVTQVVQKTMAYNMGTGQLESETNGNGKVTSYLYDSLGRPTRITYPSFTNANGVGYNVMDEISYTNSVIPSVADAENASVSSLLVSSKRKYTQVSNQATTQLSIQNDYYDGLGFLRYSQQSNNGVTQTTEYRPDDLTRAVYAKDPMNNTTTVVYDAWGAQKEGMDMYGNLYVSESNLKLRKGIHYFVAAMDVLAYRNNPALSNLKSSYVEQDYDQWGQLLVNRVYKDWPNQTVPLTELYTYDIAGNQLTYTDPKKNLNSEGVTMKYTYDALNRLSEVKDAIGQIMKYPYNASGQITNTTVQSNESDSPKVVSTKAYNEMGGLTSKTDPSLSQESYTYNNLADEGPWSSPQNVGETLAKQGEKVKFIPKDPNAKESRPDMEVDGVPTEIKAPTSTDPSTIAKRIKEGSKQAGGGGTVIVDARSTGLTPEQAAEAIAEAARKGNIKGDVEIWLKDQILKYP